MSINTIEVIDKGMKCLSDNLGASEAEIFIATILRERFDYTMWRRSLVDNINSFKELDDFIDASKKRGKFAGTPKVLM